MSFSLFRLVPAVYRLRDAQIAATLTLLTAAEETDLAALESASSLSPDEQATLQSLLAKSTRGPLESLLMVIGEQLEVMANDLDQLYDDQFIETCAPWVIPYIGDLIGYQSIHGITPSVDDPRSEVAETISLRRRKGTILVLEQLARDITGWGAHAVEYFKLLGDTQYVKHVRLHNHYAPSVRPWQPRFYQDSGFSVLPVKVDVRTPAQPGLPRPNIQNIGIYLWSLGAWSITEGTPTAAASTNGASCYRLSSLGVDMPLFHRAISQGESISSAATPVNVPDRLTRLSLCADLQQGAATAFYGSGSSLALYVTVNDKLQLLNPYQIQVANLSGLDGSWANVPAPGSSYIALIDPELGRVAMPPDAPGADPPPLTASYFYGFNAPMGGGEYERIDTFLVTDEKWIFPYPDPANRYTNLQDALTFVAGQLGAQGSAALEITSSDTIHVPGKLSVNVPGGCSLEFRAEDQSRPTLVLNGEFSATGAPGSTLILNGIVFTAESTMTPAAGSGALIRVPATNGAAANLLGTLNVTHCTLVPGWTLQPSGAADSAITAAQKDEPVVIVEAAGAAFASSLSVLGPIHAVDTATVSLTDCALDATGMELAAYGAVSGKLGGGPLSLTGCTVVGTVHAQVLTLVSNSIFWASGDANDPGLVADRLQTGCVRFSFLPYQAITPRRFECVEQALAGPAPVFFTTQLGQPAYLKLWASTDNSIRRGADDGGEMGAFHFLLAPLRETDLIVRLQEYLPVGLNAGLVYNS